jgi:uncharacterized membrane protein
MKKPRPAAVTLATGLAETTLGVLLTLLGGAWFWLGLVIGVAGAWFVILGTYRAVEAIDYLVHVAARDSTKTPA